MNKPSIFELLADLAVKSGVAPLKGKMWRVECGRWVIWVNGSNETAKTEDGVELPPFGAYCTFNGWPAGLFNPYGGTIAAGELANEDTLCEAIQERINAI